VLQLSAEGRLTLDDTVEQHLPGVVPNALVERVNCSRSRSLAWRWRSSCSGALRETRPAHGRASP
jgi:hypothetical protein